MVTIQLPGAFHDFLQKNVIEKNLSTIAYRNCSFEFITTKPFERKAHFITYSEEQFLTG